MLLKKNNLHSQFLTQNYARQNFLKLQLCKLKDHIKSACQVADYFGKKDYLAQKL